MAWPTYPYTNVTQAITGFNFSSDQVYHIINDDENSLIAAETGTIPSFRNLQKQIKQAYGTLNNRGDWVTATSYAVNDITKESGSWYLCLESHISGTFATDVSSGYWQVLQSITGIVSKYREPRIIATAGQTVFNLTGYTYVLGVNNITVIVNGVMQFTPEDFTETDNNTITFTSGLKAGDKVDIFVNDNGTSFTVDAGSTSYTHGVGGNVATALNKRPVMFDTVVDMIAAVDLVIGDNVFCRNYTSTNNSGLMQFEIVPAATGTDDGGSYIDLSGSGLQAKQIFGDVVSVKQFGAGDGGDDTLKIASADAYSSLSSKALYFKNGSYNFANITFSDGVSVIGESKIGVIFNKNANGFLFDLGRRAVAYNFSIAGMSSSYTGSGIVISRGDNSATRSLQGHQRIDYIDFDDIESYSVEYTTANKGWMSRVTRCNFGPLVNANAHVKWPDETATGGNRYIVDCYSSGAICNVGGCDNGIISLNTVGGSGLSEDGVIFPSGTTNPSKKVIICDNRLAIASGTMLVRGQTHSIDNNIIAGSITFDTGTNGCKYSETNTLVGSLTDNSTQTTPNEIYGHKVGFTPTWTADTVNPTFGNADVRATYERRGNTINVDVHITFGTTTTFGTGTWHFGNPVPIQTGNTKKYTGTAWVKANGGICFVETSTANRITLYRTDAVGVISDAYPASWSSGDQLIYSYAYEI